MLATLSQRRSYEDAVLKLRPLAYWPDLNKPDTMGTAGTFSGVSPDATPVTGSMLAGHRGTDTEACASTAAIDSLTQISVAGWLWADRIFALMASSYPLLIGKQNFPDRRGWLLGKTSASSRLTFRILHSGGSYAETAFSEITQAHEIRVPQFYVGTFDGSTIRVYLDGQFVNSNSSLPLVNDATPITAGTSMEGIVGHLQIYNRQLAPDEIRTLYLAGFNGVL